MGFLFLKKKKKLFVKRKESFKTLMFRRLKRCLHFTEPKMLIPFSARLCLTSSHIIGFKKSCSYKEILVCFSFLGKYAIMLHLLSFEFTVELVSRYDREKLSYFGMRVHQPACLGNFLCSTGVIEPIAFLLGWWHASLQKGRILGINS